MLNTIAKRIQSRLTRAGVKVSLPEIKEQCEMMISDINNPTETELLGIQNHFMSNANQLIVIGENVDNVDNADSDIDGVLTTLSIQEDVEEEAIAPQTAPLATTTKNELVATAANSLNIELSTTEIESIATNFTASSDDFTTTLDELKSAIVAFINHKVSCNNLMITNTINEIYSVAAEGFESNNQHLNDGLSQLNKALNQQSADFKSRLKHTLAKFQIPAA
jgi:hypothetical protein